MAREGHRESSDLDVAVRVVLLARLVQVVVRGEADRPVDLVLACLVRSGEADGAEDLVHLLERETLRLGYLSVAAVSISGEWRRVDGHVRRTR